jgi:hypothetical protein
MEWGRRNLELEIWNGYAEWAMVSVEGSQVSALSLVTEAASLIEKENRVLKIPNLKHQISNKSQISNLNDQNDFGI